MEPHNPHSDIPNDISKFTSTQKLAALLLILDSDNSAQILRQLDERELEAVTLEMAKFKTISGDLQSGILAEFSNVALDAASSISVKVEGVQTLLEKSVGLFRASDIMCRVMPTRAPASAMQRILEMDARHIFNQLRHEQPQTIAMVASYLAPTKTAEILALMNEDLRQQVVERLASMSPTSVEVVENVVEVLHRKFTNNSIRRLNQTGGARVAAEVLNAMPKPMSKAIISSLKERKPELGKIVLQKMFTFEELERLDVKILQKILQSVEMPVLTKALKTASEKLTKKLLSCLSKRAAESVREEISYLGPLKLRDIEAAQTQIIEVARSMENEGEVDFEEAQPAQAQAV